MGPRYKAIASFVQKGPARLNLDMGSGMQASFVVEQVSPPSPAPADAPFSSFVLVGPCGSRLALDEEQIAHIQPDGPQEGQSLYISLDNGLSFTLTRGH
ncbi:MAG: hypothetical protein ACM3WU_03900 [Bacillota bacterium]